ncbi:MAG: hypothetical protein ABI448_10655 [Bacteroidia bacterium]
MVLFSVLFNSCGDSSNKYIGKHTINIPLVIKNYDFTKKIVSFGLSSSPEVHYIDVFTSSIEFYKTDAGTLSGQFKYVRPEDDRSKIYAHPLSIGEDNFELKNMRSSNDTLFFVITSGPVQNMFFDGWITQTGTDYFIGLPKKLFSFVHSRHCTENLFFESRDFICFKADQDADRNTLFKCQVDSLQKLINVNPKFVPKWEGDIDFLNGLIK